VVKIGLYIFTKGFTVKIGVLSDTHITSLEEGYDLATRLLNGPFRHVEMILHAGDHIIPDFDSCFNGLPYYGVCGNMDRLDSSLPQKRVIDINGTRIAMTHGWGSPIGIEKRVADYFKDDVVDVIIFGHSHRPICLQFDSILLLNPGSATDRRSAPFHSVAILNIETIISADIISLD
jgi:uncharacterized protein